MCPFNNETETLRNKCQIVENIANLISRKSALQGIKNLAFNLSFAVALSIFTPILLQITFSSQAEHRTSASERRMSLGFGTGFDSNGLLSNRVYDWCGCIKHLNVNIT